VRSLLDTDDPESIKQPAIQSEIDIPKKRRRRGGFINSIKFLDFYTEYRNFELLKN